MKIRLLSEAFNHRRCFTSVVRKPVRPDFLPKLPVARNAAPPTITRTFPPKCPLYAWMRFACGTLKSIVTEIPHNSRALLLYDSQNTLVRHVEKLCVKHGLPR